jgi:hypothetical protein
MMRFSLPIPDTIVQVGGLSLFKYRPKHDWHVIVNLKAARGCFEACAYVCINSPQCGLELLTSSSQVDSVGLYCHVMQLKGYRFNVL